METRVYWMITMRVAYPIYKPLAVLINCGQLDFLSFSLVLEQYSNGAVMALLRLYISTVPASRHIHACSSY